MKDFNFTLQIKGEENKVIGNIVQNDTANRFIIRLRDGISPVVLDETDIVTVTYKRSNDTVVVDAMGGGSITVADFNTGEIVIVPDAAAIANVGMVNATVEIYDAAGKKLSSARFSFTVTPDLAGHADASTDSSFPALQNLISLLATKNDGWENAEAQRVANENVRVTNEDGRVTAEQERAQVWTQLEEMCRKLIKEMVSPDVEVKSSTPTEYILTITDKNGVIETPNLKAGQGAGNGDMLMADYDPDKDGSVLKADNAEKLGGQLPNYYMAKAIYDTDGDGVVDNAAKLGGKTPSQLTFGADQIITDESTDKRLPETLGEKMDKAGGRFTGGISFNTNFGIWFPINESLQYQFVANEWGFMLQKWVNGVWVQDILSVGGTDEIEIYQNGGANGSGWNFKNISVVKSDWSDVGSKTACIRMLRK